MGFEGTFSTGSEIVVDGGLMSCVKVSIESLVAEVWRDGM